MKVIADLHIHSRFSRATSERMNVEEIARFAAIKGLDVVGTGDFTHPLWLKELRETLVEESGENLYRVAKNPQSTLRFMITSEVCTIFDFNGEFKKVHHVILVPNIEVATQVNDRLAHHGNLGSDGRPTLNVGAPQLVEEVMSVSTRNMIFPAHAWTPWFGVLGASSGFDSVDDCYQDMTRHIHALETGLSSDPPMNWRLSRLDRFALLSNSDCHSFWPWRLGREANVFEMEKTTYDGILDAIRNKDASRFKFTIETDPAYGKYHWTGHRNCNVFLSPQESMKLGNICPVCRRPLTKGVEQRVEELADRPAGFRPDGAIDFKRLLPLSEIIMAVLGVDSPSVQKVWSAYNSLTERFGTELAVLIDSSKDEMVKIVDEKVADAIINVRHGQVKVAPGYDGVYGKLMLSPNGVTVQPLPKRVLQSNLHDFL